MTRRWGAYDAPRWANSQRLGSVGAKAVLMLLAAYADEDFSCYPGQERIADETEVHVNTVAKHLRLLEELGLLHRERRYSGRATRKTDRYVLHLDVVVTREDADAARDRIRLGRVVEGGFPQADAPESTTHSESGYSDVSAGQELPTVSLGSTALPSTGDVDYPHPGCGKELLERELLDSAMEFDLDLTREPSSAKLSTGSEEASGDRVIDLTDRARAAGLSPEAQALLEAARARNAARGSVTYLERTTAFEGRSAHRTSQEPDPDATP